RHTRCLSDWSSDVCSSDLLGFVLMLLVHELGHVFEARRQGLKVSLPTFIPFIGAYVTIERAGLTPWRNALVSLAGPLFGGAAAEIGRASCRERGGLWEACG